MKVHAAAEKQPSKEQHLHLEPLGHMTEKA